MSAATDARKLARRLRRQGWDVHRAAGHWRAYGPNGEGPVYWATTPSDRRWLVNTNAKIRRTQRGWEENRDANCRSERLLSK